MRTKLSHTVGGLLFFCIVFANGLAQTKTKRRVRHTPPAEVGLTRPVAGQVIASALSAEPKKYASVSFTVPGYPTPEGLEGNGGALGVLYRLGYVDCEVVNPNFNRIRITEKGITIFGKMFGPGWKGLTEHVEGVFPDIAVKEFADVTGITTQGNDAAVVYRWHFSPINEIGRELAKLANGERLTIELQENVARFGKFDDGWRLIQVREPGIEVR